MGSFTGNVFSANKRTKARYLEVLDIYRDLGKLADANLGESLSLINRIGTKQLGQAEIVKESLLDQAKGRRTKVTQKAIAGGGTDPLKTADVIGKSAADPTGVKAINAASDLKSQILGGVGQGMLNAYGVRGGAKSQALLGEAKTMGELQERPEVGMGGELLKLAGMFAGNRLSTGNWFGGTN